MMRWYGAIMRSVVGHTRRIWGDRPARGITIFRSSSQAFAEQWEEVNAPALDEYPRDLRSLTHGHDSSSMPSRRRSTSVHDMPNCSFHIGHLGHDCIN